LFPMALASKAATLINKWQRWQLAPAAGIRCFCRCRLQPSAAFNLEQIPS